MIYDKTRILLNPFVGLLLGCKSSYTSRRAAVRLAVWALADVPLYAWLC